ncbi:MAG: exodeoxyribonuclease III [Zoogloeaceae bacterium]|jgi:exodeoxyribonuclease-3|nr:exodeoxyribonuclease III [Zoogloeaceae bacterium]
MRLATWNVNSLKVRLPHLLDWLGRQEVGIVALQETKLEDDQFPRAEIEAAGYHVVFSGQKTYNGVALLAKSEIGQVLRENPHFPDPQKRLIAATMDGIRVICAYVPNGQTLESDKYAYKLAWLEGLRHWAAEELRQHEFLALCGDFNIAPEDRDVHDPKAWADAILCSPPERAAFRSLLDLGLADAFRRFAQPEGSFSWWDYRMLGFQKNKGLRIDHILLSTALATRCTAAGIDRAPRKQPRPSDHAPVWADI